MIEGNYFKRVGALSPPKENSPLVVAVEKNHRENMDDYPEFHYG